MPEYCWQEVVDLAPRCLAVQVRVSRRVPSRRRRGVRASRGLCRRRRRPGRSRWHQVEAAPLGDEIRATLAGCSAGVSALTVESKARWTMLILYTAAGGERLPTRHRSIMGEHAKRQMLACLSRLRGAYSAPVASKTVNISAITRNPSSSSPAASSIGTNPGRSESGCSVMRSCRQPPSSTGAFSLV